MPAILPKAQLGPGASPASPSRLTNGDRMKRPEFHRRYLAMPEIKKAELIEGIVYMPSPVRLKVHSRPHFMIVGWLAAYAAATPGAEGGDNGSVFLDLDNEPQPDAYLRIVEAAGGSSRATEDDYLEGPPEFIFEVSGSSVNYDLHQKKEAYRRNGVREYAVWRTEENAVDWWELVEGEYLPRPADDAGRIESAVFPGLLLDVPPLLESRMADVLAALQQGIDSAAHAAFVEQLKVRMTSEIGSRKSRYPTADRSPPSSAAPSS